MISKRFVLMVPLTVAWMDYGKDKLFWEPWSYLDFFSFPILQKTWPETSKLDSHEFTKDVKSFAKKLTQQ